MNMDGRFDYVKNSINKPEISDNLWAVGIRRPFYPEVYFYDDEEQALIAYDQLIDEEDQGDEGYHEGLAFISKISNLKNVKTFH